MFKKLALLGVAGMALVACSATVPATQPALLLAGPPVQTLRTPYDEALACLSKTPRLNRKFTLAVGDVADRTGKVAVEDGGTGNFVTQGGGDIVTAALMRTGITNVVERLDTRVLVFEQAQAEKKMLGDGVSQIVQMPDGARQEVRYRPLPQGQIRGSDFYVLGSINTLDFGVSSGGVEVSVAGVGVRGRQFRAVVGLDLRLVHTSSSQVVSSVSLQKQIVGQEVGAGVGRFFGNYLVEIDLGDKNSEPLQMALRSMLQLAVFDLITDLYDIQGCREGIDALEKMGAVQSVAEVQPIAPAEPPGVFVPSTAVAPVPPALQ